jgi:tetratricopeptide (TPR) repeat protein/predicted GH43/DUF377 family glycosyl hydrolase
MVRIVLVQILKNEHHIIKRCLDAALPVIDAVCICDTGSTDDTVKIVTQFIKEHKLPGLVKSQKWLNFGYNRTLSFKTAKNFIKKLGWKLDETYALFLDADMILQVKPDFDKSKLDLGGYEIIQFDTYMRYPNIRLAKLYFDWRSICVTHEYWEAFEPIDNEPVTAHRKGTQLPNKNQKKADCPTDLLQTLVIDDRGDGGSKGDKSERDIRLLLQGIKDEPEHYARYTFYLAQSYRDSGKYDEAINWYKKRTEAGGWYEEIWYSMYQIGHCYGKKKDWAQAVEWYLKAYQYNPRRAEPICAIATHYRHEGANHVTAMFVKMGLQITYPHTEKLFLEQAVYDYRFWEELSIAGFYTPHPEEGFFASERLLFTRNLPMNVKEQTHRNLFFYLNQLPIVDKHEVTIDLPLLKEGDPKGGRYRPMNPSISPIKDGYLMIYRTVNYDQEKAQSFIPQDGTNKIRTRNFLVRLDPELKVVSQQEIIENIDRPKVETSVLGMEDGRLFQYQDRLWFTCTTLDTNPEHKTQITLCRLAFDSDDKGRRPVDLFLPLKGPDPTRNEKNWLPFIHQDQIAILYSSDPTIIYTPNLETGECKIMKQQETPFDGYRFRGSASPIKFDDGYLYVIHEVLFREQRYYCHRFVWMTSDFIIKKASLPFYLLNKGVEFCCGVCLDPTETNLLMTMGVEDRQAFIVKVDVSVIKKMLQPIMMLTLINQ